VEHSKKSKGEEYSYKNTDEDIIMIMKTEDRMKRRRKNLDVYKIQDADTISMLRLLLYW